MGIFAGTSVCLSEYFVHKGIQVRHTGRGILVPKHINLKFHLEIYQNVTSIFYKACGSDRKTVVLEVYGSCEKSVLAMTTAMASLTSYNFDNAKLGLVSESDS